MRDAGSPYLLFLGDARDELSIKGATGVKIWRPDKARAQIRLAGCNQDLGLPDMTAREAADAGCRTMLVGVANAGGFIPDHWSATIIEALEAGLDVMAGMHTRLADIPDIAEAAQRHGRTLHDVRQSTREFSVGKGTARSGRRLLTVGTDSSLGKMFTSLAIEREMHDRGMKATFRATGQSGIFIAGSGIAVDGVVADFISGAVEWLAPANDPDHWDIIEGQGSLFHPSFAGVSLGLLHGAQAEALVMCHEPTRSHMRGLPGRSLPSLRDCIEINERMAGLTAPGARVVAISINTSALGEEEALREIAATAAEHGLPCGDPVRHGASFIVDALAP
ncbi:MAG: DUF1611 domain-containing protein [Deltaproteobacteria bacterium]|nr:DUF1611 domain-containing protein [Deltaproteobacteria bacterium]